MKLYRLKKMGTRLIFLLVFILCISKSKAQVNSGCLSKHQLFKMQSSSLDEIRMFLNNEGWSFDGAKSNQSYKYFDYPINYNIVLWEKSSYYNGGNIFLYTSVSKPNIVIYQSNSSCFNSLLQSFNANKGKTNIDNDKLVTIFKENTITIEFREYKNDYSIKQFSILVYNSTALYQEIQILKEQPETINKAQLNTQTQELLNENNVGVVTQEGKEGATELPSERVNAEPDEGKVFTYVDEMPTFPGGEAAMYAYIQKSIKFPPLARENGISGKVFINFIIDKDGNIKDIKVLRGVGGGCDEEAIRVVKSMPNWKPGKVNGRFVQVSFNMPVNFTLK